MKKSAGEDIRYLINRNEDLIWSNHPLSASIRKHLGQTVKARKEKVLHDYEDAKIVIKYTWEKVRGYNSRTDRFYHTFIRNLGK
jgi:hypothetical protein